MTMPEPVYHDSSRPQPAFVAIFDVLGFKDRLSSTDLQTVVGGYDRLRSLKSRARQVPVMTPTRVRIESVGTTIFSDTILLWCDDNWEAVQSLLGACAVLVASALEEGWPLRGGTAYGNCVLNKGTRTFVGQPIVDAYEVEKNQEWLGAALHETVLRHPVFGTRIPCTEDIIKYAIPVKPDTRALEYAIHWGPYAVGAKTALESLREQADKPRDKLKYANTIEYLRAHCSAYQAWT